MKYQIKLVLLTFLLSTAGYSAESQVTIDFDGNLGGTRIPDFHVNHSSISSPGNNGVSHYTYNNGVATPSKPIHLLRRDNNMPAAGSITSNNKSVHGADDDMPSPGDIVNDKSDNVNNMPSPTSIINNRTSEKNNYAEKLERSIDRIYVPPTTWQQNMALAIEQIRIGQNNQKYLFFANDVFIAAFNFYSSPGPGATLFKLIVVGGGKSVLAAENEAEVLIFSQEYLYNGTLEILKNPGQRKQLMEALNSLRKNQPISGHIDPFIAKCAAAMQNPQLGNSGFHIVLNTMLSNSVIRVFLATAADEAIALMRSFATGKMQAMIMSQFDQINEINQKIGLANDYLKTKPDPLNESLIIFLKQKLEKKIEDFGKRASAMRDMVDIFKKYGELHQTK